MALSFVPVTREELVRWRDADTIEGAVVAHQVSPGFLEGFGVDGSSADAQETSEYGVLYLASVSSLMKYPERIVLVVDSASPWTSESGPDADFGLGTLDGFSWAEVTAFYVDDPAARSDVVAAHEIVQGKTLSQAWETSEVISVLANHTLLWHDVGELGFE